MGFPPFVVICGAGGGFGAGGGGGGVGAGGGEATASVLISLNTNGPIAIGYVPAPNCADMRKTALAFGVAPT